MKRFIASVFLAAVLISLATGRTAKASTEPGGFPAFFFGCCYGLRVGAQWNEGLEVHWRECPIFFLWNGIDCYNGLTSKEFARKYVTNWY